MRKNILFVLLAVMLLTFGMLSHNAFALLSKLPIDIEKISEEDVDREILRVGIIAELDAINLYEQLAAKAHNPIVKKVLRDIAKEEKTHIGEFEALLLILDEEQVKESAEGKKEIMEMME